LSLNAFSHLSFFLLGSDVLLKKRQKNTTWQSYKTLYGRKFLNTLDFLLHLGDSDQISLFTYSYRSKMYIKLVTGAYATKSCMCVVKGVDVLGLAVHYMH